MLATLQLPAVMPREGGASSNHRPRSCTTARQTAFGDDWIARLRGRRQLRRCISGLVRCRRGEQFKSDDEPGVTLVACVIAAREDAPLSPPDELHRVLVVAEIDVALA